MKVSKQKRMLCAATKAAAVAQAANNASDVQTQIDNAVKAARLDMLNELSASLHATLPEVLHQAIYRIMFDAGRGL
jgi:hypothetical protein